MSDWIVLIIFEFWLWWDKLQFSNNGPVIGFWTGSKYNWNCTIVRHNVFEQWKVNFFSTSERITYVYADKMLDRDNTGKDIGCLKNSTTCK